MTKPLLLARLVGTQEQMGAQHGRLCADEAVQLLDFYRTMPERALAGDMGAAGKLAVRVIADAWQANLARQRPAELAARTRAFVDAVAEVRPGHDRRAALRTLATMDAMQNCVSLVGRARLGPFASVSQRARLAAVPACSTAIAWGAATEDGELLFARNFDFPGVGVWDAAPAFLVCAPDRGMRYGFFATRGADTAVVTVVNEAGLAIAPHTRWHRDVTLGGAMIVDIVHDIARRAETLADAIAIARERPASSSWGLAIGSARERAGIAIELAGPHCDVVRPSGDTLVVTNHYKTAALEAGELAATRAWDLHSTKRERRLRHLIETRTSPLSARDLARFLGDRRDPDAPERIRRFGGTLAQAINVHAVVVAPAARAAWVGVDRAPTCEGTWAKVAWEWDGPAGGWEIGDSLPSGIHAELLADFVAPHDAATRHVHTAVRAYEGEHDVPTARAEIELAIAAAPDDPSLRLVGAWLALEAGAPAAAVAHVTAGLALEDEPYRRAQLLLWGSRAARRVDPARAIRWRSALDALGGDGVDELQRAAKTHHRGNPHISLLMVDAY